MKMKINYKKISLLLVVLMITCLMMNGVYAAVTSDSGEVVNSNISAGGKVGNAIGSIITYILGMAASGVFAAITAFINLLAIILFFILWLITGANTGDFTHIPTPDVIVFNRFSFFDPNFVDPSNGSLVGKFGTILTDLFTSFQTIAFAVFTIAAMIAGIKMAFSTIASKKAQYKELALKWVSGFLVLICLKWILAGIFYINEYLVGKLFIITKLDTLQIPVKLVEMVPVFGKFIQDLLEWVAGPTIASTYVEGYLGIILANLCKSIGGNIVSSIVAFIVLGQSLTVVGSYLKRVFMCILLGIISPLIVAVDTVIASTGKQSKVFKSWLQNFSLTVFTQTVHAAYMVVLYKMLASVYANGQFTGGFSETQASIITIVLTTGLVKLEKMIKSLFGMGDSFAGDLKSGAKGMIKAMGAVKGITEGAKAIGDNVGKAKDAAKRKQAYTKELETLKSPDRMKAAYDAADRAEKAGNLEERDKQLNLAIEYEDIAKKAGLLGDSNQNGSGGDSGKTQNNNNTQNNNGDYLQQVINNQNNSKNMTREEKIQKLEEGVANAQSDLKSARLATLMGPANIAAGLGIGLGMGDDVSEALFKGGMITVALDTVAEKLGSKMADKERKTFAEHEKKEGAELGYTPSEKIIREKNTVEKVIEKVVPRDEKGELKLSGSIALNPIAVAKETYSNYKELADVFSDSIKKELKEIDKDLDSST